MTTDDPNALLLQRVSALRDLIDYKPNYEIIVRRDLANPDGGRVYAQVRCWRPDTFTSQYDWGYGGKAYLSPHAVDSEIVQTFFGLLKGYEEHECREAFRYRGRRIYGPHIDVNALWDVARRIDARPLPERMPDEPDRQDQESVQADSPGTAATTIKAARRQGADQPVPGVTAPGTPVDSPTRTQLGPDVYL